MYVGVAHQIVTGLAASLQKDRVIHHRSARLGVRESECLANQAYSDNELVHDDLHEVAVPINDFMDGV
jgi:hypothetical protein